MRKGIIYSMFFLLITISISCNSSKGLQSVRDESYSDIKNFHTFDTLGLQNPSDLIAITTTYYPLEWKFGNDSYIDWKPFNGGYRLKNNISPGNYTFKDSIGNIILKAYSLNGKQEGLQEFFEYRKWETPSYRPKTISNFKNGKKEGVTKYYLFDEKGVKRIFNSFFENDSLKKVQLSYSEEIKDTFRIWNGDNKLLVSPNRKSYPDYKHPKQGIDDGVYISFYDKELEKDTAFIGTVINGDMNYTFHFWERDGKKFADKEFLNGKLFGFEINYFSDEDTSEPLINVLLNNDGVEYISNIWNEW